MYDQISFWQNECRDQTCPAGDGSYASVFFHDSENQGTAALGDDATEERREFLFFAIAGGLFVLALLSWCIFCLCCGVSVPTGRVLPNCCRKAV